MKRNLRWLLFFIIFNLIIIKIPSLHAEIPTGLHTVIPKKELTTLAKLTREKYLLPVCSNLVAFHSFDHRLQDLLSRVTISVPILPGAEGRNARARRTYGGAKVEVDLDIISAFNQVANVAGLLRMKDLKLLNFLKPAIRDFKEQLRKNPKTADFYFNIERSVADSEIRTIARRLSTDCFLSAITWVVLHEIAHHRLCHLQPTPCDNDRKWDIPIIEMEKQADIWALKKMHEIGFDLTGLSSMLAAQATIIDIMHETLNLPPPFSSTHPTFWQRVETVDDFIAANSFPNNPYRILAVGINTEEKPSSWKVLEFIIPLRPNEDGFIFAVNPEGGLRPMLGLERIFNTIRLYGRDDQFFYEGIVSEIERPVSRMTFRKRQRSDGRVFGLQRPAYAINWSHDQDWKVGSLIAREVLGLRPIELFELTLRQAGVLQSSFAKLKQAYLSYSSQAREIFVDYARGRIDTARAQTLISSASRKMALELEHNLGERTYQHFQTAFLSNSIASFGIDRMAELFSKLPRDKNGNLILP